MEALVMEDFTNLIYMALFNVSLYNLADKRGLITWYGLNRRTWMPYGCMYCLFFWLALFTLAAFTIDPAKHWCNVPSLLADAAVTGTLSQFFYKR